MTPKTKDIINPKAAKTLYGLFLERVRRSPESPAYRYFDKKDNSWKEITWSKTASHVVRWQTALKREPLKAGDRAAIWLCNCKEWVFMDQAAMSLGLVVVPLYYNDRPENAIYTLKDAGVKFLLIEGEEYWEKLQADREQPQDLIRILSLSRFKSKTADPRLSFLDEWLPEKGGDLEENRHEPDSLATIVYTSGTTGNPKGAILSHHNILWNAYSAAKSVPTFCEDVFLSFLPLSHTFERTIGYYLPIMSGSTVAYTRSIHQIREDIIDVKPTIIISVPLLFEKVYNRIKAQLENAPPKLQQLFKYAVKVGWDRFEYLQKRKRWERPILIWPILDFLIAKKIRDNLGGRLRVAVSGGAPISCEVAKTFISLGVPLLQGYGMTETSPVISTNIIDDNIPSSVGFALQDVRLKIGKDEELLVKSPGVTQGYWNHPEATAELIDKEGWLHTGDKARIEKGRIYIIGRIKEIIVMANGEKVPPLDIETAIQLDPLIDQVMIIGEGKPYLSALVVLNKEQQAALASELGLKLDDQQPLLNERVIEYALKRISDQMKPFPGYAKIQHIALTKEPWTIENGLLTPTHKLRRNRIMEKYKEKIDLLYEGNK